MKVFMLLVLMVSAYLGAVHLGHASALEGYRQGCKDTVLEGAKLENLKIPEDVLDQYCTELSRKYVRK